MTTEKTPQTPIFYDPTDGLGASPDALATASALLEVTSDDNGDPRLVARVTERAIGTTERIYEVTLGRPKHIEAAEGWYRLNTDGCPRGLLKALIARGVLTVLDVMDEDTVGLDSCHVAKVDLGKI